MPNWDIDFLCRFSDGTDPETDEEVEYCKNTIDSSVEVERLMSYIHGLEVDGYIPREKFIDLNGWKIEIGKVSDELIEATIPIEIDRPKFFPKLSSVNPRAGDEPKKIQVSINVSTGAVLAIALLYGFSKLLD